MSQKDKGYMKVKNDINRYLGKEAADGSLRAIVPPAAQEMAFPVLQGGEL